MSNILKKLANPYNLLKAFPLLAFALNAQGQTSTQNYIQTLTPRVGGLTNNTLLNTAASSNVNVETSVQYFDGLGRLVQTVQKQASPTGNDIIQPVLYDQYGRDSVAYLPYSYNSSSPGAYRPNAVVGTNGAYNTSEQYSFYQQTGQNYVTTPYPYALTGYEPSPLNRVVEQGEPGLSWQFTGPGDGNSSNHTVRTVYTITNDQTSTFSGTPTTNNSGSRIVALYTTAINNTTFTQGLVRTNNATYGNGQLSVTISRDENWHPANGCIGTTEEYKDKQGHVVLKRTYNLKGSQVQMLSTYYVYDDYDNLAFVLPPAASPDSAWAPNQAVLNNLCYQYQYDQRNRMVAKKIPGKGWEYMIYNVLDQVIGRQDSVQRMATPNQQVSYIKYDAQGRVIATGYYSLASSSPGVNYRANMQASANAQTVLWETESSGVYSNLTIPTTGATPLSYNYYDDYSVASLASTYSAPANASAKTKGLLTVTQTAVLNAPGDFLWNANYYDNLSRSVKSYSQHYIGGHTSYNTANYDAITNYYNFANQIDTTIRQHYRSGGTSPKLTVTNTFTYDQLGRKLQTNEQIAGSNGVAQTAVVLSLMAYNQIGQLSSTMYHKQAGSSYYIGGVSYSYNERGWLNSLIPLKATGLPTGYFEENLYYDHPTGSAVAQYNGNIAQFNYNSPYMEAYNGKALSNVNAVSYTYDNLNRLTSSASTVGNNNETVSYDLIGDIKTLNRTGTQPTLGGTITYNYPTQSGQLSTVSGLLKSYSYDGNGNSTSDSTTKQLTYNLLNLPMAFSKGGVTKATYYYGADGDKLRNVSSAAGTWDYDNGIVYLNGKLSFVQTDEGRAVLSGDSVSYVYSYDFKDYLGNVRGSFFNGGAIDTLTLRQENDYYPFGLSQLYYDSSNGNRYLYNGKETQFDLANQYDYGARFYDPVIARWTTIDPLSEINRRWSPYNYVLDNPIRFEDPDGMQWADPKKDQAIADRLQKGISDRLTTENGNLKSANERVAKLEGKIAKDGSSKGLESRLSSAKADVASISTTISDLNSSSSELTTMGDANVAQKFDFNELPAGSEVGNTGKDANGVITMDIVGDANAIHEATHGFQIFKGTMSSDALEREVPAYQRQFSFDPNSVTNQVPSDAGSVSSRSGITPAWVLGINDKKGNYPYLPTLSGKARREIIKQLQTTTTP
jgi:RHS repeat-associated protein